jgi:hypothetical protein
VIGGEQRDDLVLGRLAGFHPVLPSQLERGFDGLGAAGEEVDLLQDLPEPGGRSSAASSSTGWLVNAVPFR